MRQARIHPAIRPAIEPLESRRLLTTVSGTVFRDINANAVQNSGDTPLAGVNVYLDLNNDSAYQSATEPSATTDVNGSYSMTGLASGVSGALRLVTVPTGFKTVNVPSAPGGASAYTLNVGLFPTTYTEAGNNKAWVLRIDPNDLTRNQILIDNVEAYSVPTAVLLPMGGAVPFTFTGIGNSLTVDNTYGAENYSVNLTFNGTAAANNNTLNVIATDAAETIIYYSNLLNAANRTFTATNAAAISLDPKGGSDTLFVNSGTLHIPAQTPGGGILTRTFSTLAIASNAKLVVNPAAATADRTVLVTNNGSNLSVAATGQLDLGNADLICKGGKYGTYAGQLKTGYASGAWTGNGFASSSAAATLGTSHRTALALAQNGTLFTAFDGVSVAALDLLIKYTFYGDTDLDGSVGINDFNALAIHFGQTTGNTWVTGDFDYNGSVGIDDFNLLATNFGLTL